VKAKTFKTPLGCRDFDIPLGNHFRLHPSELDGRNVSASKLNEILCLHILARAGGDKSCKTSRVVFGKVYNENAEWSGPDVSVSLKTGSSPAKSVESL